jgi:hypothetical protein
MISISEKMERILRNKKQLPCFEIWVSDPPAVDWMDAFPSNSFFYAPHGVNYESDPDTEIIGGFGEFSPGYWQWAVHTFPQTSQWEYTASCPDADWDDYSDDFYIVVSDVGPSLSLDKDVYTWDGGRYIIANPNPVISWDPYDAITSLSMEKIPSLLSASISVDKGLNSQMQFSVPLSSDYEYDFDSYSYGPLKVNKWVVAKGGYDGEYIQLFMGYITDIQIGRKKNSVELSITAYDFAHGMQKIMFLSGTKDSELGEVISIKNKLPIEVIRIMVGHACRTKQWQPIFVEDDSIPYTETDSEFQMSLPVNLLGGYLGRVDLPKATTQMRQYNPEIIRYAQDAKPGEMIWEICQRAKDWVGYDLFFDRYGVLQFRKQEYLNFIVKYFTPRADLLQLSYSVGSDVRNEVFTIGGRAPYFAYGHAVDYNSQMNEDAENYMGRRIIMVYRDENMIGGSKTLISTNPIHVVKTILEGDQSAIDAIFSAAESTQSIADWYARVMLTRYTRIGKTVSISICGHPHLEIGDKICIIDSDTGLDGSTILYIDGIQHQWKKNMFTTEITCSNFPLSGNYLYNTDILNVSFKNFVPTQPIYNVGFIITISVLVADTTTTVSIFGADGTEVKRLIDGVAYGIGDVVVSWNGKDSDGDPAPPGIYFVYLKGEENGRAKISTENYVMKTIG